MKIFLNSFKLSLLVLLVNTLNAQENDVQKLLNDFSKKNDLSQKTIDENKGHLVLFTREKLEKMHARTLKDVLKTTPVVYYHENRYGLPDPLTTGSFESYKSNFIRLYVDGVEITQGWMGSGLVLYGDVNIDFVDHIEFYYLTPSFDTSVEPAYLSIFLYSKNPKYDEGGKLSLIGGSRGYNSQSISFGEQKKDFSYMINFAHTDAQRETIDNGTSSPLSHDFEHTQLFSYIKTDNQIFHLQVMKKNTDSLAGMSYDATPLVSEIDYLNLHMDYGVDFNEHWRAQIAYDWLKSNLRQADEFPLIWPDALGANSFYGQYKNSTYTGELTYKEVIAEHHITAGVKARHKELDSLENAGKDALISPFTTEQISTIFLQDQYALSEQQLLTLGISYNYISRNGGVENDGLLQLRLGYIFTNEHWSYKTYLYRTQFSLEPLIRYSDLSSFQNVPLQTTLGITQEIAYKDKRQHMRVLLHLMEDEDSLLQDTITGLGGNTKYFTTILNYDYGFDSDNKLNMQLYYAYYKDIFNLDKLEDISGYFSSINTYENFDFYNGLVWHINSLNWKNYFDLTSSISWNINKDVTLTLKGQNLLNKAKETNLFRIDPATGNILNPLSISPIDQRITLELEYLF